MFKYVFQLAVSSVEEVREGCGETVGGGGWGAGLVLDPNTRAVRLTKSRMKSADVRRSVFECKDDFGEVNGCSGVG